MPARRTTTGKNGARGLYSPETVEFILRAFYVLAGRVRAEGGQDIYIVTARSISLCHFSGHSYSVSRREHPPERISFIDALRWLATAQPGDELPDLVINPLRPGRIEPRVCKRRPKVFPLMNKPRATLCQALLAQALGA